MNNQESAQTSEQERNRRVIIKFLDELYFSHRLITPEITQFREEVVPEMVHRWAEYAGLGPDDYFVIVVGSARTLPDLNHSDIDFIVVLNCEDEDKSQYLDKSKLVRLPQGVTVEGRKADVIESIKSTHFRGATTHFEEMDAKHHIGETVPQFESAIAVDLLFTPDKFIVGNLALARKMRLEVIEFIDRVCDVVGLWDQPGSFARIRFLQLILRWQYLDDTGKAFENARFPRYIEALKRVMANFDDKYQVAEGQTPIGRRWELAHHQNLADMTLPRYRVFRDAILAGNGALEV